MSDALQNLALLDAEIARQDSALVEQVERLARDTAEWIASVRALVRQANDIESAMIGHPCNHPHGAISATVDDLSGLLAAIPAARRRQECERSEAHRQATHKAERAAETRERHEAYLRSLERAVTAENTRVGAVDLKALSQLYERRR